MDETLLKAIDSFMDAESPEDISKDLQLRTELYALLTQQVAEKWALHMDQYEASIPLRSKDDFQLIDQAAAKLQGNCSHLVCTLESAKAEQYSQNSLFKAKEEVIQLCARLEKFQENMESKIKG